MALSLFILLISTAVTARTQSNAAKRDEIEFELQEEQEQMEAEGRELQRRQKLNKVLAGNIVGLAGAGIAGEGTPESIALESAKQASVSEGLESLSDRLKQAQLKRQAATARATGKAQVASTLLKGASQVSSLGDE